MTAQKQPTKTQLLWALALMSFTSAPSVTWAHDDWIMQYGFDRSQANWERLRVEWINGEEQRCIAPWAPSHAHNSPVC